jgi:cell division protein FtsB
MSPRANAKPSIGRRLLTVAALAGIVAFAVQGGEWGTFDLLAQRRRIVALRAGIDSLQRTVDSLKAYRKRLENDPALQERIAREEFGMVRGPKELLYRFTEPAAPSGRR